MNKYTVEVINNTHGSELLEYLEMSRSRFTYRDFKKIIASMFFSTAVSNENDSLTAYVKCDGKNVFNVKCNTVTDGSVINSYFSLARPREQWIPFRVMNVAD